MLGQSKAKMALPAQLAAFLVAVMLTASPSIADGARCTLPFNNASTDCTCSATNITCSGWSWDEVPQGTTSLTISGTVSASLTNKNRAPTALPILRTLNLTGNSIRHINRAWFTKFPSLEELILDRNNLTLRDTRMFANVSPALRILSLDRSLDSNHTVVVENLKSVLIQSNLANLEVLRLDNNNIAILFPFSQLAKTISFPKLRLLSLHNASLISLSNGTFPRRVFPKLRRLDLSANNLRNVDQGLEDFRNYTGLTIDFSGNPFYCNCRLDDFQDWLNATTQVLDKQKLRCEDAVDKASVGKPILEARLVCVDGFEEIDVDNELQPSYIILSVILALVGLLALAVLYMRRNDMKDYFVDLYTNTKEAFQSRQGYDAISRVRRDTPDMAPTEV